MDKPITFQRDIQFEYTKPDDMSWHRFYILFYHKAYYQLLNIIQEVHPGYAAKHITLYNYKLQEVSDIDQILIQMRYSFRCELQPLEWIVGQIKE